MSAGRPGCCPCRSMENHGCSLHARSAHLILLSLTVLFKCLKHTLSWPIPDNFSDTLWHYIISFCGQNPVISIGIQTIGAKDFPTQIFQRVLKRVTQIRHIDQQKSTWFKHDFSVTCLVNTGKDKILVLFSILNMQTIHRTIWTWMYMNVKLKVLQTNFSRGIV